MPRRRQDRHARSSTGKAKDHPARRGPDPAPDPDAEAGVVRRTRQTRDPERHAVRKGGRAAPPPPPRPGPAERAMRFDTGGTIPDFRSFRCREQEVAWGLFDTSRVMLLLGRAGSGKTHIAVARALHDLIVTQSVRKIVLCRPAVEAGEKLGFLPGDLQAKIDPYFRPIHDCLDDLIGTGRLREQVESRLETAPVGFLRGRTFQRCFVILDEAQNCTDKQLKLALTRLGRGSKFALTGDPGQSDLPDGGDDDRVPSYGASARDLACANPVARLARRFQKSRMVKEGKAAVLTFQSVVRDELVGEMLDQIWDGDDS